MAHDVFISYSQADKSTADAICHHLEEAGIRCWIAPRDVGYGKSWDDAIVDAIGDAAIVVVVFSAAANESRHVLDEVAAALDSGVTVIPFRIEDIRPTGALRLHFGRLHWLDALTEPLDSHIDRLIDNARRNLARKPDEAETALPPTPPSTPAEPPQTPSPPPEYPPQSAPPGTQLAQPLPAPSSPSPWRSWRIIAAAIALAVVAIAGAVAVQQGVFSGGTSPPLAATKPPPAVLTAPPPAPAPPAPQQQAGSMPPPSGEPIKIGFSISLTGGLSTNAKSTLIAMQIWQEETNANGGLLGRPVKLVFYDDQSNPSAVPAIYSKLLDVDAVDFVLSGYGTNMTLAAMPLVILHEKLFFGFGTFATNASAYPKFFSMLPLGPDPKHALSAPFFNIAMAASSKPVALAIVAVDGDISNIISNGARDIAKQRGLSIVYDKTYPFSTTEFGPIVRAVAAANPDMVFIASFPADSVGMLKTVTEIGLKARFLGGGMIGPQFGAAKQQLGPKLNGVIGYDFWMPAPTMQFPGALDFLRKYQSRAGAVGADPLGWSIPPFAYASLQILAQVIEATRSLDQNKLAEFVRGNTFKTIVGDVSFGPDGEWTKSRVLEVQWQGIKGNTIDDFKDTKTEVILTPDEYKTGTVVQPYDGSAAK